MKYLTKPRFNWIDSLNTIQMLILTNAGYLVTAIVTVFCLAIISAYLETKYWSEA